MHVYTDTDTALMTPEYLQYTGMYPLSTNTYCLSYICCIYWLLWPWWEAIGTVSVIVGIILPVAKTLGLKQHIWCAKTGETIALSQDYFPCYSSNLRDMTNSITEILKVEAQQSEWQAMSAALL